MKRHAYITQIVARLLTPSRSGYAWAGKAVAAWTVAVTNRCAPRCRSLSFDSATSIRRQLKRFARRSLSPRIRSICSPKATNAFKNERTSRGLTAPASNRIRTHSDNGRPARLASFCSSRLKSGATRIARRSHFTRHLSGARTLDASSVSVRVIFEFGTLASTALSLSWCWQGDSTMVEPVSVPACALPGNILGV